MTKTLNKIIENINLKTSDLIDEVKKTAIFETGIVEMANAESRAMVEDIHSEYAYRTIDLRLNEIEPAEFNIGDNSNTEVVPLPLPDKNIVKIFYTNQWLRDRNIQAELHSATDPEDVIKSEGSKHLTKYLYKLIIHTLKGFSGITEISGGSNDVHFTTELVQETILKIKKDNQEGVAGIFMHSATCNDVLSKQGKQQWGIEKDTIVAYCGNKDIEYRFEGVSIILDDDLPVGEVFLLNKGAFYFAYKNLADPVRYHPDVKIGSGFQSWCIEIFFIMHPAGFDFVGVHNATIDVKDYSKKLGLNFAELGEGSKYELRADPKDTKIICIKVVNGGDS